MNEPEVKLAEHMDASRIAPVYARAGRVHIAPILGHECAVRVYRCIAEETPWQLHFNEGERVYDLAEEQVRSLSQSQNAELHEGIHRNAGSKFQYLFSNFPISDVNEQGRFTGLYLMRVFEFLNSPRFLEFVRVITGVKDISVVDAQATLYRPGHFLTRHDDTAVGKNRVAAYVLNLTPRWSADWGGILNFIDADGHIAEGYTPVFNALNVFKVPQAHSVSYVAPFAQAGRYSITGWLRTS